MAENQEIKVFFGGNDPFGDDTKWNPPEDERKLKFQSAHAQNAESNLSSTFGFQMAKTAAMGGMQRIGMYTGNYITQNALSNAEVVASWAGSIAMAIATQNPIPLIIQAVNTTFQIADYQSSVAKGNVQAQMISNLTGTSATNRSRGAGGKI